MADTLDDLISGLQNYVVAPLNAFGLGGYLFDVQGEARAIGRNEITDHYTESNQAVQDHIAVAPKRITLRGYVGELVFTPNISSASNVLQQVTQKLTSISTYLPKLSAAATQAQAALDNPLTSNITLNSVQSQLPAAADIYGLVKNSLGAFGNQSRQQNAYQYFDACRTQGILMGIQTPWEFLTNMAVETVESLQFEDSIFMSDFSVTFKQLRIVSTQTAVTPLSGTGGTPSPGGVAGLGAFKFQNVLTTQLGIVPGSSLPSSLLPGQQSSIVDASSILNGGLSNIFNYR